MQGSRRRLIGSMGLVLVAPGFAQSRTYRIGILALGTVGSLSDAFFSELERRGWTRDGNLQVDLRSTAAEPERAVETAADMIKRGADILVVAGTSNAIAARKASRNIPIVMIASGFPVESGLAASLARPGGNVTGLSVYAGDELFAKYVALVKELVPGLRN